MHGVDVDDEDVLTYRSVMDQIIAALIGVVAGTCAGYGISAYKRRNKIKAGKDPSLCLTCSRPHLIALLYAVLMGGAAFSVSLILK